MWKPEAWKSLRRRIARILGNEAQADDVIQSAILRTMEYRAHNAIANEAGFVTQTAVHLALDERRREHKIRFQDLTDFTHLAADDPLQDEIIEMRQKMEQMKAGLAQLPHRTREIFLRHRLDGLKYREIAEQEGISMSAVEKHIAKAVLNLADWMRNPRP